MEAQELKKRIEEIIDLTFKKVQYSFDYQKENVKPSGSVQECRTRLVFPSYGKDRSDITRISEQELRFAFVEAFNEYCKENKLPLYYSVETPTRDTYSDFSKTKENPNPIPRRDDNGRSGEFDMVIFEFEGETLKRRCLIEFKANNASKLDHEKDFVKLNNHNEHKNDVMLRYFIEILDTYNKGTISSLQNKIKESKGNNTIFICYSLNKDKKDKGERIEKKIFEK